MKSTKPAVTILIVLSLMIPAVLLHAQEPVSNPPVNTSKEQPIVRVEADHVCMGMGVNRVFDKVLLPAVVDGKTYYGCCEGCQANLLKNPNSRIAIDPVTGEVVDKATAVIGALSNGVVHYFENEETMKQFAELIQQ
ncbi:MAG: hypothetical protein ACE5EE_08485 [Fidelibacterota bacterium]